MDAVSRKATQSGTWIAAHARQARWVMAGPGAVIVGLLFMAALPVILPRGMNGLVFPVVLAPLIWAAAFFYVILEENVARAALAMSTSIALLLSIVLLSVTGALG